MLDLLDIDYQSVELIKILVSCSLYHYTMVRNYKASTNINSHMITTGTTATSAHLSSIINHNVQKKSERIPSSG
jgi:hypothetical protein